MDFAGTHWMDFCTPHAMNTSDQPSNRSVAPPQTPQLRKIALFKCVYGYGELLILLSSDCFALANPNRSWYDGSLEWNGCVHRIKY